MKESDLYLPLKQHLEAQHYEVKGEVENCDVLAIRGDETPVVVELKLSINLTVVLQSVDRLSLTPIVYIGIPAQCKALKRQHKQIIKLLKMLGLGLITINPSRKVGGVKTLLDPGEYQPKESKQRQQRLLGEFSKRVGDPNLGGVDRKKGLVTAYRQRAVAIAQFLKENGPTKASQVATSLQDPKARNVMYRDVYGWFDKVSLGIYTLSPRGSQEINQWETEV
jgi:hypothetical protein